MNGAVEWTNEMIEQYLRCYVNYQQTSWADLLPFAVVAYNNAVHSSTGLTPFQITTGMEFAPMPELPQEPPSSMALHQMDRVTEESVGKREVGSQRGCKTPQRPSRQAPIPSTTIPNRRQGLPLHQIFEGKSALQEVRAKICRAFPYCMNH